MDKTTKEALVTRERELYRLLDSAISRKDWGSVDYIRMLLADVRDSLTGSKVIV